MTQEEEQLLLNDLYARLPYGVNVKIYNFFRDDFQEDILTIENASKRIYTFGIPSIKPYLRPMSSMTDEERKEYTSYCFEQPFLQKDKTPNLGSVPMCIDWLNKNMFDYRGLIPMGLALEAKEGMYKN